MDDDAALAEKGLAILHGDENEELDEHDAAVVQETCADAAERVRKLNGCDHTLMCMILCNSEISSKYGLIGNGAQIDSDVNERATAATIRDLPPLGIQKEHHAQGTAASCAG